MKKCLSIFSIMILAAIMIAFTESRIINGRVTDVHGNPIRGVAITVKGADDSSENSAAMPSAYVAITDYDGKYALTVDKKTQYLIFSKQGYKKVLMPIGGKSIINVILKCCDVSTEAEKPGMLDVVKYHESKSISSPSGLIYTNTTISPGTSSDFNTENYASVNESGYKDVTINPLSTFSIDVDNASYSNIRRFINMGKLPPADAVRIEEMLNYFKYDYPEPDGEHPFSVYTEMAVCPWNKKHHLLHVGLHGKSIDKSDLPPSNIVFLIDVSGSMNAPNKLPLLKSAFGLLVNELRPQDRVAIVVYAGAAGLVLESTPGNKKAAIFSAIDKLAAGGSTAGGAGLKLAYSQAEENFIKGGNNRIILATDGDFNVGESSNGGMERLIEEKREHGVFITVLGFGMGNVKDDKMEIIADKGNGNYSYIDNLQEARKVLVSEFGGTLFTIAKDVKFQIEFNPSKIQFYRLIGYENRLLQDEDFNNDRKDAGDMGAGHNVTALYELIPANSGIHLPSIDPLKYQKARKIDYGENDFSNEYLTIKLRYKEPDGNSSSLLQRIVTGNINEIGEASENMRFAAAVSEFGMILRDSEFRGDATLEGAASLARSARGYDDEGYRSELIRLINTVKEMKVLADRH